MLSQSTLGKTLAPGRSQAPQPTCHKSSPLGPADAASSEEGGREGGASAHKCQSAIYCAPWPTRIFTAQNPTAPTDQTLSRCQPFAV